MKLMFIVFLALLAPFSYAQSQALLVITADIPAGERFIPYPMPEDMFCYFSKKDNAELPKIDKGSLFQIVSDLEVIDPKQPTEDDYIETWEYLTLGSVGFEMPVDLESFLKKVDELSGESLRNLALSRLGMDYEYQFDVRSLRTGERYNILCENYVKLDASLDLILNIFQASENSLFRVVR